MPGRQKKFKMRLIPVMFNYKWFQFVFVFFVAKLSIMIAPFTKVEESFQLQGVHDFLYIGFPKIYNFFYNTLITGAINGDVSSYLQELNQSSQNSSFLYEILPPPRNIYYEKWDHEEFPGVVPRTFIPSFVLAVLSWPVTLITDRKLFVQLVSRMNLALIVIVCLLNFGNTIVRRYGKHTRSLLLIITCTQFHFIFYASRTLPNTFPLALVLLSYSYWLRKDFNKLIILCAFTVLIFRFETIILYGIIFIIEVFFTKKLSINRILSVGIPAGILAILTTFIFDSLIWGKLIWPELESMYFNLYLNKSHLWGTQPYHWYFLVALPKAIMFSLPFCFFATKRCVMKILPVAILFVAIYSFLPHKELRFILYVVPLFNLCSANALAVIFKKLEEHQLPGRSWLYDYIISKWTSTKMPVDVFSTLLQNVENDDDVVLREMEDKHNRPKKEPVMYDVLGSSLYQTFQLEDLKELAKICSSPRKDGLKKRKVTSKKNKLTANVTKTFNEFTTKRRTLDECLIQKSEENSIEYDSFDEDFFNDVEKFISLKFITQFVLVASHLCFNIAVTIYILFVSVNNYPGGESMVWLNEHLTKDLPNLHIESNQVGVHLSNLVTQTGFTRFMEWDEIAYDKSPNFLIPLSGKLNSTIYNKKHSLAMDLTKFKLIYLLLENVDGKFIHDYCTALDNNHSISIDRFECKFGKIKNCRVIKIIYGLSGIYLGLDSKFLKVRKTQMVYMYRCLNTDVQR